MASIITPSTKNISIKDINATNDSTHYSCTELLEIYRAVIVAINPNIPDLKETKAMDTDFDWGTLMAKSIYSKYIY